jgi:toxin ParE1/3/4
VIREIVYEQSARDDLRSIYFWIAERAGPETALAYVERIRSRCDRLASFPDQGTSREDLVTSLRTIAFERTAIIAYIAETRAVRILRVLRKGRDLRLEFPQPPSS